MTRLVNLSFVRAHRAITAEKALELVDCGALKWVFDMSTGHKRRGLRFLTQEVISPEKCFGLTIDRAFELILGKKQTFSTSEIETQFVMTAQTLMRLRRAGEIEQLNGRFTRASVTAFLRRRLQ